MKLATLQSGQFVETNGYYNIADGAGAKYFIKTAVSADGYGDHALANGNVAVLQKENGAVNFLQYGAKSDGLVDTVLQQQACIDNNNLIYRTDGDYLISAPLKLHSDLTIIATEKAKVINDLSNVSGTYHAIYDMGNCHPDMYDYSQQGTAQYLPCHDLNAVAAGINTLVFNTSGDEGNYSVGQFVVLRSIGETNQSGGIPQYMQYAKVESISSGQITLDRSAQLDVSSACLSPLGTTTDSFTGDMWDLVENITLDGGIYDCRNYLWTRTGFRGCTIKNFKTVNSGQPIALNAVVESLITDWKTVNSGKVVEIKCGSHDSTISNGTSNQTVASTSNVERVDTAEQSRNILLDNITYTTMPSSPVSTGNSGLVMAGINISATNITGDNNDTAGQGLFLKTHSDTGDFKSRNLTVSNFNMALNAVLATGGRIGDLGTTLALSNVSLHNIKFTGETPTDSHLRFENVDDTISWTGRLGNEVVNAASGTGAKLGYEKAIAKFYGIGDFTDLTGGASIVSFASGRAQCWSLPDAASNDMSFLSNTDSSNIMVIYGYFSNLTAASGDFVVRTAYKAASVGEDLTTGLNSADVTVTALAQDVVIKQQIGFIRSTDSEMLLFRVGRDGANAADTLAGAVGFLGFKIEAL